MFVFSYEEGALVADESGESTQKGDKLKHSKRASREYIPSAKVGSRLPHMPVRALTASSEVCPLGTYTRYTYFYLSLYCCLHYD